MVQTLSTFSGGCEKRRRRTLAGGGGGVFACNGSEANSVSLFTMLLSIYLAQPGEKNIWTWTD